MLTEEEEQEVKLLSWRYRLAYVDYPVPNSEEPERQWGVVEYWPELRSYTGRFVEAIGDDKESLLKVLQWMITDISRDEKPIVLEDEEPDKGPRETPYDQATSDNEMQIAAYDVGSVPEHLLKMGLLLAVKRDCYLQGQADGRAKYLQLAVAGRWALDCIKAGPISTAMVAELTRTVTAMERG